MADLLQHKITVQANSNPGVALPTFTLEARVVDSETQQTVILDLTGANAVQFVLRVQGFTVADHRDLVQMVAQWIIQRRAGLV